LSPFFSAGDIYEALNWHKTLFTQLFALFKYFLLFALAKDFCDHHGN